MATNNKSLKTGFGVDMGYLTVQEYTQYKNAADAIVTAREMMQLCEDSIKGDRIAEMAYNEIEHSIQVLTAIKLKISDRIKVGKNSR